MQAGADRTQPTWQGRTLAVSGALRNWGRRVWHHLPVVLLLTCLTAVLHGLGLLHGLDAFMMREVVRPLADRAGQTVTLAPVHARVHLLEISAGLRLRALEADVAPSVDDKVVKHLDGIRPLDRAAIADLLDRLALRLAKLPQRRRVLAVDVDLAPLPPGVGTDASAAMIAALDRLRSHADVVVAAMDGVDPDAQRARNAFMRDADCTRFAADAAEPGRPGGLYFASPLLFRSGHSYPLRFPTVLLHGEASADLPPAFPGLGMLVHLLRKPVRSANDRRTLTALCEQARTASLDRPAILEDVMATAGPQAVDALLGHYDAAFFNWALQDSHLSTSWTISSPEAIGPPSSGGAPHTVDPFEALGDDRLDAPVLVLSVRGAGRNDRYAVPSTGAPSSSGARLHALQAVSLARPLEEAQAAGALVDLLTGVLFVACWALAVPGLRALEERMPQAGFLARALVPLAIVVVLAVLSGWLATRMMGRLHVWFNPALVIAGLALHAWLQRQAAEPPSHGPDWSFGLRDSLGARPGRQGRWRHIDLWLASLVKAGIVAAGFGVLVSHAAHPVQPVQLALLLAAAAAFVAAASRPRKAHPPGKDAA